MNRIRELRQRIRQLEAEMARSQANMRELERRREQSQRDRLNAMRQELNAQVADMQRQNARQIEEYYRSIIEMHNESVRTLENEYRQLQLQVTQLRREYQSCLEELNREIEAMNHEAAEKERLEKEILQEELGALRHIVSRLDELPHEFFCPNEFGIYRNEYSRAAELAQSNLNQVAIGTVIGAQAGLARLELKVHEKLSCWNDYFSHYRATLEGLEESIRERQDWSQDPDDGLEDDLMLTYWSEDAFGEILDELGRYRRRVDEITAMGINAYLKENHAFTIEIMRNEIDNMNLIPRRLNIILNYSASAAAMSLERDDVLAILCDTLRNEQNMEIESYSFDEANAEEAAKEAFKAANRWFGRDENSREDFREAATLEMDHMGAKYRISIVPIKDSRGVKNKVYVSIYNIHRATPMAIAGERNDIINVFCNALGERYPSYTHINFADSVAELNQSRAADKSRFKVTLSNIERQEILAQNRF